MVDHRMSALASELADAVKVYLETHPVHCAWVNDAGPLRRRVPIAVGTWLPWLRDGTRPGRRAAYTLPPAHSIPAVELLDDARLRSDSDPSKGTSIDRPLLEELACAADGPGARDALNQLFVATMMWGSGTTNGRGPRRTAQALSDPSLTDTLLATRDAVHNGDLSAAHRGFRVSGVGESFFTKWFWAASLNSPTVFRPLILDDRVRATMHRMLSGHAAWVVPRHAAGYVDYVTLIHTAATLLAPTFPHIDAEKLEWLLFDRSNHTKTTERCLGA